MDLLRPAKLAMLLNRGCRITLRRTIVYISVTPKKQAMMILRKKQAEQRALRTKTARLRQAMVCSQEADPAATLRWNDCLEAIYGQLSGEERMLGMYRRAGYPWSEIAALMNSSPARLQKRFERAIRRAKGLLAP
jgi:DNA-directed RNA polymerase specialized sigma24 family protein